MLRLFWLYFFIATTVNPLEARCFWELFRRPVPSKNNANSKFEAALRDTSVLEAYDKSELEDFISWAFPRDKRESERSEYTIPYAAALRIYTKKHLLTDSNSNNYVIRSYDDLIRFGLFEIEDGKLKSKVHLQGNNLAAMQFDFKNHQSQGYGLTPTSLNSSTTYFRPAGNVYNPSALLGYVGKVPYGTSQEFYSMYFDIGTLVAIDPENHTRVSGVALPAGHLEGQTSFDEFLKSKPRVYVFDPKFADEISQTDSRAQFRRWLSERN